MSPVASIVLIVLDVAGLFVWGVAALRWRRGMPPLPARSTEKPEWKAGAKIAASLCLLWVAIHLASRIVDEWKLIATDITEPAAQTVSLETNCLMNLLLVGLFLVLLSDFGQDRMEPFGLTTTGWRRETLLGAVGYLAALPAVHAVLILTYPLRKDPESQHPLLRLLQADRSFETVAWVAITVIVMAPLAEEIVYRVTLQGALRTRFSAGVSIGISSVLFAGVHGFPDSLALIPLAAVMGYVYERRRSYVAVVVLHALFNATTLLLMLSG